MKDLVQMIKKKGRGALLFKRDLWKCVVQYAHEKLDQVHVKNRVFSDLSFHFLVAVKIELLLQPNMKDMEKTARLHFLRMLCYHHEYLNIENLRDQYDATLNIERGQSNWSDFKQLEAQMHSNLTFRATVNACGKVGHVVQGGHGKVDVKVETNKEVPIGKIVYCLDDNKGTCPFDDHHQGIFNEKECTKWHIFAELI